mgnify:CR=1 FL=1
MATLGSATRILSHHLKLIGDSDIRSDQLQSLHSSGLFPIFLRCSEPHRVDHESLRRVLMVIEDPPQILHDLCRRKLAQAARARKQKNMGGTNNWHDCMKEASTLLRRIYNELSNEETVLDPKSETKEKKLWQPLSERYQAEACALLLHQAYGRPCEDLDEAFPLFREATKDSIPCHVCHWAGHHYGGLQCEACKGTKLLSTRRITCPECGGTGEGIAYESTFGGDGVCGLCVKEKEVIIDSLGKHVSLDASYILQISLTL